MRAGWDLNTAVRPDPESLGPKGACHCPLSATVTHQIPTSDPGPETLMLVPVIQ